MPTRRHLPLHVFLGVRFGALMLLVGVVTCGMNFLMSKAALEASANDAMQRISRETLDHVEDLMLPAQMAVKLISHSSLVDATSIDARLARVALVRDALDTSPALQALYVGYDDGSFFYVRPLRDNAERALFNAPSQAAYVVRSIDPSRDGTNGRLYFLDANLAVRQTMEQPGFATLFDPRKRPWYTAAMADNRMIRTEPYMFFSDRQAGATIAMPAGGRRAVVGGDFRLDSLGVLLSRNETIPRGMLALLDNHGRVIAIDRPTPESTSAPDTIQPGLLAAPAAFGLPVLTRIAADVALLDGAAGRRELLSAGGEMWHTTIDRIAPAGGKPLYLVSAIPQAELLRSATRHGWMGLVATAMVIVLALPLVWLAARRIAQPLHALAKGARSVRRFEFQHPIDVPSRIGEVRELNGAMEQMRQTIARFLEIVQAVSAESRLDQLLPVALRKMLDAAGGGAGALYLAHDVTLHTMVVLDDNGVSIDTASRTFALDTTLPLIRHAVAASAPRGDWISAEEGGATDLAPLVWHGKRHVSAIPLVTRQHELFGVIVILRDQPIESVQLGFLATIGSLFAGAIEARELADAQRELFDAFIRLLADAIDAKSPHTGGHCKRVPEIATMLARAACDAESGPYASFSMSPAEWESLHVAAWLHDCGKVTTPEYVIDKATKLETLYDRIHEIRMRFEVLRRDAEIRYWQALARGDDDALARKQRDAAWHALDDDFAFVAACNLGSEFMDAAQQERLRRIATQTWTRTFDDRLGISHEALARKVGRPAPTLPAQEALLADKPEHRIERDPHDVIASDNPWGFVRNTPAALYDRGELHNLLIGRGTLSDEERFKIEDHIVQTQIMLSRLPFPRHLGNVPEIAGNHHEKMDGTGYPRQLRKEQMSPLARMMAIADVFEALTAADRPYKKAKPLSESIRIMAMAVQQQHLDADLFALFLTSGVYLDYARKFMRPEQIDHVDIARYVSAATTG